MSESREHIIDEIKDIAPTLSSISRDKFEVPEGYFSKLESELKNKFQEGSSELEVPEDFFESMHSDILGKIANENEPAKVVPLKNNRVRFWISTAASLAAVGLIMFWLLGGQEEKCETFACLLERTELSNSDLMVLDEVDLYQLVENEEDLVSSMELHDDDLLDYLEEDLEDITIDDLYE